MWRVWLCSVVCAVCLSCARCVTHSCLTLFTRVEGEEESRKWKERGTGCRTEPSSMTSEPAQSAGRVPCPARAHEPCSPRLVRAVRSAWCGERWGQSAIACSLDSLPLLCADKLSIVYLLLYHLLAIVHSTTMLALPAFSSSLPSTTPPPSSPSFPFFPFGFHFPFTLP